jgi:hypothetical protein
VGEPLVRRGSGLLAELARESALARLRVTAHPSEEGCKKYLHMDKCPSFPTLSFW